MRTTGAWPNVGDLIEASCKCGFRARLAAGGGMANFATFCGAPATCENCRAWQPRNYLDDDPTCDACGGRVTFYDDPKLREPGGKPGGVVFSWNTAKGRFMLTDARYLCPRCGEFRLRFENVGNWD